MALKHARKPCITAGLHQLPEIGGPSTQLRHGLRHPGSICMRLIHPCCGYAGLIVCEQLEGSTSKLALHRPCCDTECCTELAEMLPPHLVITLIHPAAPSCPNIHPERWAPHPLPV
eukprot:scaffold22699_cov17-Tisochrysis_lutea.AAC.1